MTNKYASKAIKLVLSFALVFSHSYSFSASADPGVRPQPSADQVDRSYYPKYSEAGNTRPIPKGHHLVPAGKVVDQTPGKHQSGASEKNSTSKEHFTSRKYVVNDKNPFDKLTQSQPTSINTKLMETLRVKINAPGILNTTETAYFQGRQDAQGRQLIFKFEPHETGIGVNHEFIREGTLSPDNIVIWSPKTRTRIDFIHEINQIDLVKTNLNESEQAQYKAAIDKLARISSIPGPKNLKFEDFPEVTTAVEIKVGSLEDGKTILGKDLSDGDPIYRMDINGTSNRRVMKFINQPNVVPRKYARIGTLINKDGQTSVRWLAGYYETATIYANLKVTGSGARTQTGATPNERVNSKLMEPVKIRSTGSKWSFSKGIPQRVPIMETAYYEGRQDAQGRELIFRPITSEGSVNKSEVLEGTLGSDGIVTWKSETKPLRDLVADLRAIDLEKTSLTAAEKQKFRESLGKLSGEVKAPAGEPETKAAQQETSPAPAAPAAPQKTERLYRNYPEMLAGKPIEPGHNLIPAGPVIDHPPAVQGRSYYPNYPEAAKNVTPLAASKSLVPQGPVVDQTPGKFQSGYSEGNSTGKEHFVSAVYEVEKPSRLDKTLEWSDGKTRRLAKAVRNWAKNGFTSSTTLLRDFVDDKAAGYRSALENSPKTSEESIESLRKSKFANNMAYFTSTATAWYFVLGLAAAYNLELHYSDDPAAWTTYLEGLTSPVGYMQLGGFILAAHSFYKRMGGSAASGTVLRQIPLFAGGLLAGSLVGSVVGKFARDEDVQRCLGFKAEKIDYKWQMDLAACDRSFLLWTRPGQMADTLKGIWLNFIPEAAGIVASTPIFLGTNAAINYIFSRPGVINAVARIPVAKFVSPNAISLMITAGNIGIFFGSMYIANTLFDVEQKAREEGILTNYGFTYLDFSIPFFSTSEAKPAKDLFGAETQLLKEWARIKKNHWKLESKKVCYDSRRSDDNIYYNCDEPDALEFGQVIENYGDQMSAWRNIQLGPVIDKYKAWLKKAEQYTKQIDKAYVFYKGYLLITDYVKRHPEKADGFDKYLSDLTKNSLDKGSLLGRYLAPNFNGSWKYINTPREQDFLLTSMACGPEVEGYNGSGGMLASVTSFLSTVTGNYSPGEMIKDWHGFEIKFYPPRITQPLQGTQSTVCDSTPGYFKTLIDVVHPMQYSPANFPVHTESKDYVGLSNYIRDNIRGSAMDELGLDQFDYWWDRHVTTESNKVQDVLRADYKKLLEFDYSTALKNHKYICDVSSVKNTGLEKILRMLDMPTDTCSAEALHRVAYGILDSLRDEMRLYLAMLIDLYAKNTASTFGGRTIITDEGVDYATKVGQYSVVMTKLAHSLLTEYDDMIGQLTVTDRTQRHYALAAKKADDTLSEMRDIIDHAPNMTREKEYVEPAPVLKIQGAEQDPDALTRAKIKELLKLPPPGLDTPFQKIWAEKLLNKTLDLLNQTKEYYKILTMFEVETAKAGN